MQDGCKSVLFVCLFFSLLLMFERFFFNILFTHPESFESQVESETLVQAQRLHSSCCSRGLNEGKRMQKRENMEKNAAYPHIPSDCILCHVLFLAYPFCCLESTRDWILLVLL